MDQEGKWIDLLGVQEAVGSNPAVPTFRIRNLRAPKRRPFCFGDIFGDIFDSISRSFLITPQIAHETASRRLPPISPK